jgi:O-antigen ligase
VKHISYFLTIAMIVYVLSNLINTYSDFRNFCGIISIFGLIIIFIAYYEITSGVHFFRSSLQDTSELDRSLSYITENQAWFTFGNPNDLSVHVVVCLFATVAFSRSIFYTAFYFFTVLYLVQFLDSRILVVSLVIFALVFCAMVVQKTPKSAINITIVSLIGGLSGLVTILVFIDRVEFLDISSFIRLQLVSSALDMAKHTLLIGIGAGGFETEMWQGGYLGRTTGIVNPHNGFARILAENGIVGLALFLCLLFGPLIAMRRASSLNILLVAISSSVVVLPLLLSVGSDPLSSSSLQLAIAFLWVGARFATNDDHNRNFAPDSLSYVLGQRRIA